MNNPSVFPHDRSDGMHLRDYFATAALTALIKKPEPEDNETSIGEVVRAAYAYADLMLKERAK